ncbi:two-component regulator propeller domain-containing protein [Roseivirga sp. BDSF3-8]|uniref:two-component regulator propeller domain-containing protein n=1 Tax=Roseivirga sp. BDSF3-8 TaxID=3241598 RepID=UPI003531A7FD
MGYRSFVIVFLVLVLLPVLGMAQEIKFQHLGIREGLKSSKVFDIVEDDAGFVWFATENGISRYDGSQMRTYMLDRVEGGEVNLKLRSRTSDSAIRDPSATSLMST